MHRIIITWCFCLVSSLAHAQSSYVEQRSHSYRITSLAWSPDSKRLVSGDENGFIKLWDVDNRVLLRTIRNQQTEINQQGFSPDGQYFASAGNNKVTLSHTSGGKAFKTIALHKREVTSFEFHPRKSLAASSTSDTILIWSYPEGKLVRTLAGDAGSGITFSPDGNYLATYSGVGKILLWNINSNAPAKVLGEFNGVISVNGEHMLQFSPAGKSLIIRGAKNSLLVIEGKDFNNGHSISWPQTEHIQAIDVHPSLDLVAAAGDKGQVNIYTITTGTLFHTIDTDEIRRLAWSPNGEYLAGAARGGKILLWDKYGKRVATLFEFDVETLNSVKLSPNEEFIVWSGKQSYVRIWNLKTGMTSRSPDIHKDIISDVSISPNSKVLVTAGGDKKIGVWSLPTMSKIAEQTNQPNPITAIRWSRDGNFYASGDGKGIFKIWDARTHKSVQVFADENRWTWPIINLSWSPDSRYLAVGYATSHYQVWDVNTRVLVKTFKGYNEREGNCHDNGFIEFSLSGVYIAGPTLDCSSIVVWRAEDGSVYRILSEIGGATSAIAFSKDEKYLFSTGTTDNIQMWDLQSGKVVQTFSTGPEWTMSAGSIWYPSLNLSQSGKWIVTADNEGTVRLWNRQSGVNKYSLSVLKNLDDFVFYVDDKPAAGTLFALTNFLKVTSLKGLEPVPPNSIPVTKTLPAINLSN